MENKNHQIIELEHVVVKLAGDSGDGMQLSGSQFSDTTAIEGHDLATFPDYPSEIRAPQGTVAGVSGFQLHFGHIDIETPGDLADVLIALNPAALKVNMKWVKPGAIIIVDVDSFEQKDILKAGYTTNPLEDGSLDGHKVVKAPITSLTRTTCAELGLDAKSADRTKNQFALGILYFMFHKDIDLGAKFLEEKFARKELVAAANKAVLEAGYHFAENLQEFDITYRIKPAENMKGRHRSINGNTAAAWGLIAAAEKAGLELFLGSYPITPATEILQELAHQKQLGVKTLQAEDEIAGINSAIGAAFAGKLAATSTSGPGLALKSEAIGLAVITELPLVIIDVQRGGPSTGLPTKIEQSDLLQAVYGRNGECPIPVIAAHSPADCFDCAIEAFRLAVKYMTPVIFLSDGGIGNAAEPWRIPDPASLPKLEVKFRTDPEGFQAYARDANLARPWVRPGTPGLEHRVGGLEKDFLSGNISHDPVNHQRMVEVRAAKVEGIARDIPPLQVEGPAQGDLLVVGWGSTYGSIVQAREKAAAEGRSVAHVHLRHLNPFPADLGDILKRYKKVLVPEMNLGQLSRLLRERYLTDVVPLNKVQGKPFKVSEIYDRIIELC